MGAYLEIPKFLTKNETLKVELGSVQFGVGRGISAPTGTSSKREASAPSITEIVITRTTDKYSPLFFQESVSGNGRSMTIYMTQGNGKTASIYLTIHLENVLISGYSFSNSGDKPVESITLNFTKIEYKYTAHAEDAPSGWTL